MKFLAIASLVATSSATIGADCSSNQSVCTGTECCGTATKDNDYTDNGTANLAKDGVVRSVCNTKTEKKWVETLTGTSQTYYTSTTVSSGKAGYIFACKATIGSVALKASIVATAALVTISYA